MLCCAAVTHTGAPNRRCRCESCPAVYHTKCAGLRKVPKGAFYCPPCKAKRGKAKGKGKAAQPEIDEWSSTCMHCNRGGNLLCCDGCTNAAHLKCTGLLRMPSGDWFCDDCRKKGKLS